MKQNQNGIKTRRQRSTQDENQKAPFTELTQFRMRKQQLQTVKQQEEPQHNIQINHKKGRPAKNKKILKDLSTNAKQQIAKNNNQRIIKNIKQKINGLNHDSIQTNSIQLQKQKQAPRQTRQTSCESIKVNRSSKINDQINDKKNNVLGESSQKIILQKQTPKTSINKIIPKLPVQNGSAKIEPLIKKQKRSRQIFNITDQPSSKGKQIKNKIPLQNEIFNTGRINLPEISQVIQKKKYSKKMISQKQNKEFIPYKPSLQEQKSLDQFIEHAIKLRKLKNQKQFFQSFSRIVQFIKDSWQFGDLNKKIKFLPSIDYVMKVGIQISRGIRKQSQIHPTASHAA